MQNKNSAQALARWSTIAVSVAVYAKTFVPFYLIGSTAIFAVSVVLGMVLIGLGWRPIFEAAGRIPKIFILTALLYAVVAVNFLVYSRTEVPATYLCGILIFHGIFLIFGFSAARALKTLLIVLSGMAVIYAALIVLHAVRFGGVMTGIYIDDIFGIGDPAIFITFHQNIGLLLCLGALSAFGLASNRTVKILTICLLPMVLLFLFHIAARTALVALVCSMVFLGFAALWAYSRKTAVLTAAAAMVAVTVAGAVLSQRPITTVEVDQLAPDAMSRTIRELRNPDPGLRMQIWTQAVHQIVSEPGKLLFGRGIGMYPVNEGFGAPDWLLHLTEGSKHYPHNVYLEMLYETGITGLLLFSIITVLSLVASLRRWHVFSSAEKSAVAIYVFILVSSEISGAFAYTYMLQFFLALTVGVIALKHTSNGKLPRGPIAER